VFVTFVITAWISSLPLKHNMWLFLWCYYLLFLYIILLNFISLLFAFFVWRSTRVVLLFVSLFYLCCRIILIFYLAMSLLCNWDIYYRLIDWIILLWSSVNYYSILICFNFNYIIYFKYFCRYCFWLSLIFCMVL